MDTNKKKLITHDGSFHADDVFAAASLSLLLEKKGEDFEIIRTRDPKIIETGDYVFDVGGIYDPEANRFDHHQLSFKDKREEGILYSSFGLVWKKFGLELAGSEKVAEIVEKHLVTPVDAFDNGFDLVKNNYSISPFLIEHFFLAMRPTWCETDLKMGDAFLESVKMAKKVLSREIIQARDAILAGEEILKIYQDTGDKRIIILNKNYPYEDVLNKLSEPIFVVYPRSSDTFWGVKAVKDDPKVFKNRKNFPINWTGLREEELQKITGVSDAVFCHKGLFMAVAKTREGAIELAKLALE